MPNQYQSWNQRFAIRNLLSRFGDCEWSFVLYYFQKLRMIKNSFRLIQQFQVFLAHPTPPLANVQLIVCINENICLKTYFTSEKHFINHCMYKKINVFIHSQNSKKKKKNCLRRDFFLACLRSDFLFLLIYFSPLIRTLSIFLVTRLIKVIKNQNGFFLFFVSRTYFLTKTPTMQLQ